MLTPLLKKECISQVVPDPDKGEETYTLMLPAAGGMFASIAQYIFLLISLHNAYCVRHNQ